MTPVFVLVPAAIATLLSWHSGKWLVQLSLAFCFLTGIIWAVRRKSATGSRAVVPFAVLTMAAVAQLAAGSSAAAYNTLKAMTAWGAWAVLFIAGLSAFREAAARRTLFILFGGLAGIVAGAALLMPSAGRLGIPGMISMAPDYMAGPFPNRNIYACFAELGLPVTVWLAVKDRNPVWWFASSAIVGSVLSAGTRAGAIIILCECAILCVLAGRRRAVPILGGAAIVAVIASGGTLMTRLSYANPFELRSDLALSSVRLALERPLLGWGLGSYASVYPQFATFDVGRRVDHAHNDWLEWAAEAGIPAGLLIAGFFLSSLRGVTRHWWTLGIAAVCIHACVDYPLQRQGVALWVILLVAAITAARKAERDDGQRPPCAREVTEPVRQPGRAQPGLR